MSAKDVQQWKRTELNLGYLVDLIEPKVSQLNIFVFVGKPFKYRTVMKAYRLTAEELRPLENYRVSFYDTEFELSKNGAEWKVGCGQVGIDQGGP